MLQDGGKTKKGKNIDHYAWSETIPNNSHLPDQPTFSLAPTFKSVLSEYVQMVLKFQAALRTRILILKFLIPSLKPILILTFFYRKPHPNFCSSLPSVSLVDFPQCTVHSWLLETNLESQAAFGTTFS